MSTFKTSAKRSKAQQRRDAIWKQAEELGVPAFMTPLWQATYGRKA